MRALVLGGGNALGAYLAGAYEALHRAGEQPDWVAGSSIGAISAALIAGNPPDLRVRRLRTFWELAAAPDWVPPWRRASQWAAALEARLAGRPNLFHPRLSNWIGGGAEHTSFFDPAPLRRVLTRLIDFDMVNSSAVRVSIQAVDLETGEAVAFDTRRDRLEPDHLLASAALIPDFPPVRIGERWLVDGGLAANVPVGLVLAEDLPERSVCYVADPFPLRVPRPQDLAGLSMRQTDLTFACQTDAALRHFADLYRARARAGDASASVDVAVLRYGGFENETALKSWDYSRTAIDQRWQAGGADMERAIRAIRNAAAGEPGLRIHSGFLEKMRSS